MSAADGGVSCCPADWRSARSEVIDRLGLVLADLGLTLADSAETSTQPSHTAESHSRANVRAEGTDRHHGDLHTAESHSRVTRPSPAPEQRARTDTAETSTQPSHTAESNVRAEDTDRHRGDLHTAESHGRVTQPSHTSQRRAWRIGHGAREE